MGDSGESFAAPPIECSEKWAPFALAQAQTGEGRGCGCGVATSDRRKTRREWRKGEESIPGGAGYSSCSHLFLEDRSWLTARAGKGRSSFFFWFRELSSPLPPPPPPRPPGAFSW